MVTTILNTHTNVYDREKLKLPLFGEAPDKLWTKTAVVRDSKAFRWLQWTGKTSYLVLWRPRPFFVKAASLGALRCPIGAVVAFGGG